jgi:hypothetical protein
MRCMAKAEISGHYMGRLQAGKLVRCLYAWRNVIIRRRLDLQVTQPMYINCR